MNATNLKQLAVISAMAGRLCADISAFNCAHGGSQKPIDLTQATPRPVRLQMNTKGAWRDVLDFDCADEDRVKTAAELLFRGDKRVTLRVIAPKLPGPPLMCWSDATGWRLWGDRHGN